MSANSFPSATTTTFTCNPNCWLLSVENDGGHWVVSERRTNVYGVGDTLLSALLDFWTALGATLAVLDDSPCVPRLQREREEIRRLLGRLAVSPDAGTESER